MIYTDITTYTHLDPFENGIQTEALDIMAQSLQSAGQKVVVATKLFRAQEGEEWENLLVFSNKGYWAPVKGQKEQGETVIECAYRELSREAGIIPQSVLIHGYLGTYELPNAKGGTKCVIVLEGTTTQVHLPESVAEVHEVRDRRWVYGDTAKYLLREYPNHNSNLFLAIWDMRPTPLINSLATGA